MSEGNSPSGKRENRIKEKSKFFKKVLKNPLTKPILYGILKVRRKENESQIAAKRSLKIEQQIGNESTKRTEKLKKCLVNSKEKKITLTKK